MKTKHYNQLRHYVMEVVTDMVRRGKIRRLIGQTIEEVLRAESTLVLEEIESDLQMLAREMGFSFVNALQNMGSELLKEMLFKPPKKR